MNVKSWYEIADSTVYVAIKTLEKKAYIAGKVQKDGNMPDKTVSKRLEYLKIAAIQEHIEEEYPFPYFCPPCRAEMACWEVSQTLCIFRGFYSL